MRLLSWLKDKIKKGRIKRCRHPVPWEVLEYAPDMWFRGEIEVRFHKGNPPSDNPLADGWCRARIIRCKKCGGILDEIKLGEKWLQAKKDGVLNNPGFTVKEMAQDCGTMIP